ncbi:flagellar basal body P-ring protein FlgI [Thiohalophilus sp.]|uniref:flagellar basal body P-ring protein FlgI n=1 Tax=Thiohalophilus sp. TaxID=3028392 RepID=UPI002ACEB481|nr:flagellar basal body P-ring protein FlgI [Thiohalophilus sp.]MDZ7802621.1 flagellar basal body P-ring protein FlgI [Thiohalophilus sp.]
MLSIKELGFTIVVGLVFVLGLLPGLAQAERIKDVARVAGVRSNQLVGYGLVVGLNGTGDGGGPAAQQSLRNMMTRLGVRIPEGENLEADNVAVVSIHAELPPFSKPGKTIDVTVSSVGGADSLRGGALLMTPLRGVDDNVYAVAQGNLIVSGFGAAGNDGSSITVNVPTVGRIPNGATVERVVDTPFGQEKELVLNLHHPDFTTSTRMARVINRAVGKGTAHSVDPGSVSVNAPTDPAQRVAFVSMLENLTFTPGESPARVIVNSRTGTVVIGKHVQVTPAAVAHGSLTVTITADPMVSQPGPLAGGETAVVPRTDIDVEQADSRMFKFAPGVSLDEIVRAVNEVGAAPGDLVAILEALKEAGALRAELVVI